MPIDSKLQSASIVVAAIAGIFLGMAIASFDKSLVVWSKDWQTLITGVLAVFAAGWTVMQMAATDITAERRHNQLYALSIRADRLRVERATIPWTEKARECAKAARRETRDINKMRKSDLATTFMGEVTLIGPAIVLALFEEVDGAASIDGAKDLFDADLAYTRLRFGEQIEGIRDGMDLVRKAGDIKDEKSLVQVKRALSDLADSLQKAGNTAAHFCEGLEKLASEYR